MRYVHTSIDMLIVLIFSVGFVLLVDMFNPQCAIMAEKSEILKRTAGGIGVSQEQIEVLAKLALNMRLSEGETRIYLNDKARLDHMLKELQTRDTKDTAKPGQQSGADLSRHDTDKPKVGNLNDQISENKGSKTDSDGTTSITGDDLRKKITGFDAIPPVN